jgi:Na+/proline symporter
MSVGVMVFIFLVVLLLISISPIKEWQLSEENPLDEDRLRWSEAGYGSASVSLNCLFGAAPAVLLLIGYTCFAGIVLGVVGALLIIQTWISPYDRPGFQFLLFNLKLFQSPPLNLAFSLLLVFCQAGLALAEMVLLHHVFSVGLGFSDAHATVATLAAACVAYYYCLFGGYQALFRADLVQYVFIIAMGLVMIVLLWRNNHSLGNILAAMWAAPNPTRILMPRHPHLRSLFELLGGFAFGTMPVLAAPDAWKRVLIVSRRKPETVHRRKKARLLGGPIAMSLRSAPLRLLAAAAVPLALILPVLMSFRDRGLKVQFSFPIRELFALAPPIGVGFILLGMLAAFMSTFDGALISATHILIGLGVLPYRAAQSGLGRFRVIFGFLFTVTFLLLIPLIAWLPNPYSPGALLVVPFALVSGLLIGTSFGKRRARSVMIYVLAPVLAGWVFLALRYLGPPASAADPYAAVPLVSFGCFVFFVAASTSRVFSVAAPQPPTQNTLG